LYDYSDSQSVVSEAVSIDLSLIKEQQQQRNNTGLRGNALSKASRGQERGMGKLLLKPSSISSDISHDLSSAENSFGENEEISIADHVQFGGGGGGLRMSASSQKRASLNSEDNSFWNNEENSFADYMQFGGQKLNRRTSVGSMRSGSIRLSELRFDHDDASMEDSVLSMGSFALEGDFEISGFEGIIGDDQEQASKASMTADPSPEETWESPLKAEEGEEMLKDRMPLRSERRAQRARDRISTYSRTPSRNGSIGSIASGVPKRKDSLGKYSSHSRGSIVSAGVPRSSGSLGKYSDHSSGVARRNGSLGKYSDHSMAPRRPRRRGSIGARSTSSIGAPIRSQSANGGTVNSAHVRRSLAAAVSGTRGGSPTGKAQSARVLGSSKRDTSPPKPSSPDNESNKNGDSNKVDGNSTLPKRNGKGPNDADDVTGKPTEKRNGKGEKKTKKKKDTIVSPKVTKSMNDKLSGSSSTGISDAALLAAAVSSGSEMHSKTKTKRKGSTIKLGKDSDNLPRSANLRQQLLG